MNPLFQELRKYGVGCHVGGLYLGIVAYADDVLLLAPNRSSAQFMLGICEKFSLQSNISFSLNEYLRKTKCKAMYVAGPKSSHVTKLNPLVLCGTILPWVEKCDHLGHTLCSDGS